MTHVEEQRILGTEKSDGGSLVLGRGETEELKGQGEDEKRKVWGLMVSEAVYIR